MVDVYKILEVMQELREEEINEGQIYSTGGGAGESQRYYNAKPAGTIIEPAEEVTEASPDTLEGSFTPDLVESKTWLANMLAKGLKGKNCGTIYILGSWYGNMAIFLQQAGVKFKKIVLVEPDQEALLRSKDLLQQLNDEGKLILIHQKAEDVVYEKPCIVINTSCNETGPVFLTKLPDNVLCCLQARNNNEDSLFPTEDMEDFVDYFPLSKTYYTGKKYLEDPEVNYVRYMMIGRSGKKVIDEAVSTGLGGGSAGNNGGQMVGGPETYEQEYNKFKSKGPRVIRAMTYETDSAQTVTLNDLYHNNYPDDKEVIWNFVGQMDFDTPYTVQTINPAKLSLFLTSQYHVEDIRELVDMLSREQKLILRQYSKDNNLSNEIIVMADGKIIDGNHRALAAALTNKPIRYIDMNEEPLNEIDHASKAGKLKWDISYKDKCDIVGQTEGFDIYYMPVNDKKMFMILGDNGEMRAFMLFGHSENFPDRMSIHRIENVSGEPGLATTLAAGLRNMGAKFVIDKDEPLTLSGLKWVNSLIHKNYSAFKVTDQYGNSIDTSVLAKERENAFITGKPGSTSILIEFSDSVRDKLTRNNKQWLQEGIGGMVKPHYLFYGAGYFI